MASKYGVRIRDQFPEHSPIHEEGNPMRELIEEGIGPEFDQIENDLFTASVVGFYSRQMKQLWNCSVNGSGCLRVMLAWKSAGL